MSGLKVLCTGGAGFAGSNIAKRFCERGDEVRILDNLSRPGGGPVENAKMLLDKYKIRNFESDVGEDDKVYIAVKYLFTPDVIVHCAAQTSLRRVLGQPYDDFRTNALGTLNVLEAARAVGAHVVYFSTNKVYGSLEELPVIEQPKRYTLENSVSEKLPVAPHLDPYSLSKTAGDQYCQLYPKTTVLRFSSLYGPGQYAISGQGWLGVFGLHAAMQKPVVISGNGKQVRDVLHAEDLCNLIEAVVDRKVYGVFNAGGGEDNSWSILEYLDFLNTLGIKPPPMTFEPWHTWTEKCYITDISKIQEATGWKPTKGDAKLEKYVTQWLLPEVLPRGFTP